MLAAALNHRWSFYIFDFHVYCKGLFVINISYHITDNDDDQT